MWPLGALNASPQRSAGLVSNMADSILNRLRRELEKTLAMNAALADRVRELEAERERLKNNREDTSKAIDAKR